MSITTTYKNGNIIIDGVAPIKLSSDFYYYNITTLDKKKIKPKKVKPDEPDDPTTDLYLDTLYSSFNSEAFFVNFQKNLRYLDCLKDNKYRKDPLLEIFITNPPTKPELQHTDNTQLFLKSLVEGLEKNLFYVQNKESSNKLSWIGKDAYYPIPHKIDYVFYETGLDPKYFIYHNKDAFIGTQPNAKPTYVRNVANDIIDPFKRHFQKERKNEIFGKDKQIKLDQSFMNLFGFNDIITKLDYKYITSKNEYDFHISTVFGGKEIKLEDKDNEKFFDGNNEKAEFCKISKDENKKKAFIVSKELGDVLQVLLMYIWSKTNNKDTSEYTMVTVDRVVYLFCQLMGQPCHYFNNKDDNEEEDEDGKKKKKKKPKIAQKKRSEMTAEEKKEKDNTTIREIQYFTPVKYTPEMKTKKLKRDFEDKKR